jgi:hypothetical protein
MSLAGRAEDQPLIKAINDAQRRYRFSDASAEQLRDDFTKAEPALRQWIFDLCDPSPRASPFMTDDHLASFTREVGTRGQDYSARWTDLTTREQRLAQRIKRFVQDKRRVWKGAGPPHNVDRALILYVIRHIEEVTGAEFRFWQHRRPAAFDEDESSPPLNSSGGPMLRLAEAALLRLFHIDDRTAGYLGLVSPAQHYKRDEIARTEKLARRASRTSPASPAKWQSKLILALRGDVRIELAGKNTDHRALPSSWSLPREVFEAAVAGGGQTRLKYGSGLDLLKELPDLIELSKQRSPRVDVKQEQWSASTPPRSRPMVLLAERILPDEPPAPPPPRTDRDA